MQKLSKRFCKLPFFVVICALFLVIPGCGGGGNTSRESSRVYRGTFTYGFEAMTLRPCGNSQPVFLTGRIQPIFDYIREQNGGQYPAPGYYNYAVKVRGQKAGDFNALEVSEVIEVGPEDTTACP